MQVVSRVRAVGLGFGGFVFSRDLFRFEFHSGFSCCLEHRGCQIHSGHHNGRVSPPTQGNPNKQGGLGDAKSDCLQEVKTKVN